MIVNHKSPIAFQGELGAFSHSAAMKLAGTKAALLPCESFKQVFQALRGGDAAKAVIPIENTLHGSVYENYDYLLQFNIAITGETTIRISHNLVVLPGVKLQDIRRAYSHPVALNQCRRFFDRHPQIEPVAFYDTAGSVKMLKEQRPAGAAAIASDMAARLYGARILQRNIEDNPHNFTRFFLLSKQDSLKQRPGPDCKTSVVFSTPNTPGALFRAMACFALRDLNLTKIESRPLAEKPWEYLFYVDLIGAQADTKVVRALDQLREIATFFKVLGSYRPTP
jgi:prephenate dehydratase